MDDAHLVEKPFLFLYRLYLVHPWWVLGFFIAYCIAAFVNTRSTLDTSEELLAVAVFLLGIGPFFFFFGLRAALWILLRARGFKSDDLKIE
ncbi:MAG: hypothetical protein QNI99_10855 [Woeseiaceae bacterium]|nr:hypothetical protein [Woeseiaceae bacterium]